MEQKKVKGPKTSAREATADLDNILRLLEREYPHAETALRYDNSFQLLLAVILSAQTTDKQVNKTTEKLFQKIKEPRDILKMNVEELEKVLQGCGLYRQKKQADYGNIPHFVPKIRGKVTRNSRGADDPSRRRAQNSKCGLK
jgi:endonuclease-3